MHLATAEALDIIKEAKADGLPITVETTNHHLAFSAENVPDGATEYKCCPPIRGSKTRVSVGIFKLSVLLKSSMFIYYCLALIGFTLVGQCQGTDRGRQIFSEWNFYLLSVCQTKQAAVW